MTRWRCIQNKRYSAPTQKTFEYLIKLKLLISNPSNLEYHNAVLLARFSIYCLYLSFRYDRTLSWQSLLTRLELNIKLEKCAGSWALISSSHLITNYCCIKQSSIQYGHMPFNKCL